MEDTLWLFNKLTREYSKKSHFKIVNNSIFAKLQLSPSPQTSNFTYKTYFSKSDEGKKSAFKSRNSCISLFCEEPAPHVLLAWVKPQLLKGRALQPQKPNLYTVASTTR